jgi:hypothetical protein
VRSHHGRVCRGAWHGECFKQADQDRFPILDMQDLEDSLVNSRDCGDGDSLRFKVARDGDHLMTPFQCVECHFVNLKGRYPDLSSHKDALAVTAITRAILDSLWSRERTTVESNRGEGLRYLSHLEHMGLEEGAYPARGPFPKEDLWGMRVACALLSRSLAKGRNSQHVQFETVRKLRAHYSNVVHASSDTQGHSELHAVDRGYEVLLSSAPTNSLWFKRFMIGCHRRMGDVWLPDRPLTAPILSQAIRLLSVRWAVYGNDPVGKLKVSLTACMLLAGYYGALRGEEIVRVDAGLIAKHWEEASRHEQPHIPLLLTGRFKQVDGPKIFCQPLAKVTQAGMNIGVWFRRVLDLYEADGISSGPFFRISSGRRAGVADLDVWFRSLLKAIQSQCPHLINDDADLGRFSMRRSARRGATSEAQNSGIPDDVIEANNRWRKKFRSKGLNPRMSMLERYTDAEANIPKLIRFSYLLRH